MDSVVSRHCHQIAELKMLDGRLVRGVHRLFPEIGFFAGQSFRMFDA